MPMHFAHKPRGHLYERVVRANGQIAIGGCYLKFTGRRVF